MKIDRSVARLLAGFAVMLAISFILPSAVSAYDDEEKIFTNPMIGSHRADGCYSWPGSCKTRAQANAFCRSKGFEESVSHETSNQVGTFSTKRLGDGGVCRLSCNVLTEVICIR